jgi:hypothetical protein
MLGPVFSHFIIYMNNLKVRKHNTEITHYERNVREINVFS